MQQQFVPPIQINFNAENKNDLFGVPMERALELVDIFSEISIHAYKNIKDYTVYGTGEHEGVHRLDDAKIFSEYLAHATNMQEWLFVIYNATMLIDEIRNLSERRTNQFKQVIDALLKCQ